MKFQMMYCFVERRKVQQAIECFEGTEEELNTYIQNLKKDGCYGFSVTKQGA